MLCILNVCKYWYLHSAVVFLYSKLGVCSA